MGQIMTDAPARTPPGLPESLDTTRPNIARVYDALLGGKDNFAADREVAQQMIDVIAPYGDATEGPRQIRAALMRAVRYLATEAGISQFVDLGSGLPTQQNVHEVVQRHRPGARVVYVDSDPMVLAHGRALLARDAGTVIITADFHDVDQVLSHPDTRRLIDFSQPVGLIMSAILHHVPDEQRPRELVAAYRDRMPEGSHLFLTHLYRNGEPGSEEIEEIFQQNFGSLFRTAAEIEAFFTGWQILPPGLVYLPYLLPDRSVPDDPADLPIAGRANLGAIARLPAAA
jgi:S-adenosyl methyltransferase